LPFDCHSIAIKLPFDCHSIAIRLQFDWKRAFYIFLCFLVRNPKQYYHTLFAQKTNVIQTKKHKTQNKTKKQNTNQNKKQNNNLVKQIHEVVRLKRKPKCQQQMQQTQLKHSSEQHNRKSPKQMQETKCSPLPHMIGHCLDDFAIACFKAFLDLTGSPGLTGSGPDVVAGPVEYLVAALLCVVCLSIAAKQAGLAGSRRLTRQYSICIACLMMERSCDGRFTVFKAVTFRANVNMCSMFFLLLLASRKPLYSTGSKLMSKSAMVVLPKSDSLWHEVDMPICCKLARFLIILPSFLSDRARTIAGPESQVSGAKQVQWAKARDTGQGQKAGPGGSGPGNYKNTRQRARGAKGQAATATDL
jgi:hypothetical protein